MCIRDSLTLRGRLDVHRDRIFSRQQRLDGFCGDPPRGVVIKAQHHGKDVYGALAYNQEKVDRGDGKVLLTHIVREPADGRFNVAATAEDLLRWMPSHYRTEKPVVHVSLNPAPEDRLDDGQLAEIAGVMSYDFFRKRVD